jgi:hypothetical protein
LIGLCILLGALEYNVSGAVLMLNAAPATVFPDGLDSTAVWLTVPDIEVDSGS